MTDMDAMDESLPEKAKGSVRSQLSNIIGVGESYIQQAKKISETDAGLFEQIFQGKMTMQDANAAIYRQTEAALKDTSSIVIRKNDERCSLHNCDLLDAPIEGRITGCHYHRPPHIPRKTWIVGRNWQPLRPRN